MAGNTSQTIDQDAFTATVAAIQGDVFVVANGHRQAVQPGRQIQLNETLVTEGNSVVVVTTSDGRAVTLGHDQALTFDQALLDLIHDILEESAPEGDIKIDLIAQTLEGGGTIDDLLPAPAAGGIAAVAGESAAGSVVRVTLNESSVTPESGFETTALSIDRSTPIERNTELPLNPPVQQPSVVEPTIPLHLNVTDQSLTQDQPFSLNLTDYLPESISANNVTFSISALPDGLSFDQASATISGTPSNTAAVSNGGNYQLQVTVIRGEEAVTDTFAMQVANMNDLPSINAPTLLASGTEDTSVYIANEDLLVNVTDMDGDSLTPVEVVLTQGHGNLVAMPGGYYFEPVANWSGIVELNYRVSDGHSVSDTTSASFQVSNVNDAPVSVRDNLIYVDMNKNVTVDLVSNDYDLDGDAIFIANARANNGALTLNADGSLTYTPTQNYYGRDIISYTISDGQGGETVSLALVNIRLVNAPPQLGEDESLSLEENNVIVGNYTATDPDGDSIVYQLKGVDAALFSIDADNSIHFVHGPDFEAPADNNRDGVYEFTLIATDTGPLQYSDSQNFSITVTNILENTAPVLGADQLVSVSENTQLVGNFAAIDAEGDQISYSLDGRDASLFSVDGDGNLNFINTPDFESNPGPFNVTIVATDNGEDTLSSSQTLTIINVNEVPVATAILDQLVREDFGGYQGDLTQYLSDAETPATDLTDSSNNHLPYSINNGIATFSSATNDWSGNDTLTGTVLDDLLIGGGGEDTLFGLAGHDSLYGNAGIDTLWGGQGNDFLTGGEGNDLLVGGIGEDILFGEAGVDTFAWQAGDEGSSGLVQDTVLDFVLSDGDVLDFAGILQNESADATTLHSYFDFSVAGSDTQIAVDIQGDGSGADLMVVLHGVDLSVLGSDQQILQQLLSQGNLHTD